MDNDTFYVPHAIPVFDENISPEIYLAYTQFLAEIIRQLIDEPLIPFNLTAYAKQIDQHVVQYLAHYGHAYESLSYHIGNSSKFFSFGFCFDCVLFFKLSFLKLSIV